MPLNLTITPGGMWMLLSVLAGNLAVVLVSGWKLYRWAAERGKAQAELLSMAKESHREITGNGSGIGINHRLKSLETKHSLTLTRVESAITQLAEQGQEIGLLHLLADRSLIEQGEGYFECNGLGENLAVRHGFAEILGTEPKALLGRGWGAFIDPEEREDKKGLWESIFMDYRAGEFRLTMLHKEGFEVLLRITLIPADGEEGRRLPLEARRFLGVVKNLSLQCPCNDETTNTQEEELSA